MQGPVPTTLLCVLAGLASVALVVNGKNFDQFLTCSACIAAGHGWNAAKYRCGGYKTRHCAPGAGNLKSSSFFCSFNSSSFCLKSRTRHSASGEPRVLRLVAYCIQECASRSVKAALMMFLSSAKPALRWYPCCGARYPSCNCPSSKRSQRKFGAQGPPTPQPPRTPGLAAYVLT